MRDIVLNPVALFCGYLAAATLVYLAASKRAAKGKDHDGKYLPYSSGQRLPSPVAQLRYQAFFRIGLLFAVLHVAALVISLVPFKGESGWLGLMYLAGISCSALVLARTRSK